MDLDEFLYRPSLKQYPLSLLVRLGPGDDLPSAIDAAAILLEGRHPLDEIVVPIADAERLQCSAPPRVKFIPHAIGHSKGLELALRLCRWPVIVTYSPAVRMPKEKLDEMLEYLEQCDLVVGRRRGVTPWWAWPLERPIRWLFGVPVADPLCPVKAFRRPAIAEIILENDRELVDFELVAKLTYLTSLMDECDVSAVVPPRPLIADLLANVGVLARMFFAPRFWNSGQSGRSIRPKLNDNNSLPPLPRASQLHVREMLQTPGGKRVWSRIPWGPKRNRLSNAGWRPSHGHP